MTFDEVVALATALPGVEAYTAYGTPAFRVKKKFLGRLREDGDTFAVRLSGLDEREILIGIDPETYFFTDHYRDYPYVLVSLARVRPDQLAQLLRNAWRVVAPARFQRDNPLP